MKSLSELIDIIESVEDSEDEYLTPPELGDDFAIEIDDYCLESHIIRSGENHIVLECDTQGYNILESAGLTFSEEQLDEAEYHGHAVTLNKPQPGDVKKFKVFVKDPKTGNIKKVNFGDKNMRIKKSNPARRKSFRARHHCENPGPKTSARYWSCRKW